MRSTAVPSKSMADHFREWMQLHFNEYRNYNNEVDMTMLGEACANNFGLLSDEGDTYIEDEIFEIASEFFDK